MPPITGRDSVGSQPFRSVLSLIPPMTQLNTPYPSTAYLTGFLRSQGVTAKQEDLALGLVLELLSSQGLRDLAATIESRGGSSARRRRLGAQTAHFLRHLPNYLSTIDPVIGFLQGHDSTLPVTQADMVYHVACVARGCERPLIIADMPFGTYQESPELAFRNAAQLMAAGAQMVKIEGGRDMATTTAFLTNRGIPVCGHIGLTPQSVFQLGGYRVQGRGDGDRERLLTDALALEEAGASLLVLEAMPAKVADFITDHLRIPTIGIGASAHCSGQVLVLHDMLDIAPGKKPRFVKNFMAGRDSVAAAIAAYVDEVRAGTFPGPDQQYPE